MKKNTLFLSIALILLWPGRKMHAQIDTLLLKLEDVVNIAQSESPEIQIAETAMKNSYWQFQSFLADFRPQINLQATLPNLNRSIDPIVLPDGSEVFISRALMRNSLGITLSQDIPLTGGSVFARTRLQRIDVFGTSGNQRNISYLSTPISIGLIQPLFGFNGLKWARRIEPIRYEESKRLYSEDALNVAFDAAALFFDVLIAQLNSEAALRNKVDADTLYAISQGRYSVGRIAETELLQIELNVQNAETALAQSQLTTQTSTEALRNFLGIQEEVAFDLIPPYQLPAFALDAAKALEMARLYRSETVSFRRRLVEADQDMAQARGNTGPSVDLFASFGLSQTGSALGDVYADPLDQEQIQIGLEVPIADWGKARSVLEIARSNASLTRMRVEQERVNFEREILVKVQQFDLQRRQVDVALRAYEVAQKRLDITRKRYRIGKILITDLNLALSEEANARRNYFNALREFWLAYYDLRRLTLYDFEQNRPLTRSLPASVEE
ncbi:MAG: TolC family protein [Saprospiraceae bacterium]|nr:TolC family protein [Saprospiraceae bacterium]